MITLDQIQKSFGSHHVLRGIRARFETGKVNYVIGRSGSGKSVLTKCTVGLIEPDSGHVEYDGRNFTAMNRKERRVIRQEIGMLFQGGALFDSMTVEQNVQFPLRMFSDLSESGIRDRAQDCLRRVQLEDAGDRYPAEISGGMQKRVGIARAISMNPKYLFCDEPNSGLDPQTAIVIDNLIKDITYEYQITTVVISHDMNSVMEASDTIHFVHEGQILWNGNRDGLLRGGPRELDEFVFASNLMRAVKRGLS